MSSSWSEVAPKTHLRAFLIALGMRRCPPLLSCWRPALAQSFMQDSESVTVAMQPGAVVAAAGRVPSDGRRIWQAGPPAL